MPSKLYLLNSLFSGSHSFASSVEWTSIFFINNRSTPSSSDNFLSIYSGYIRIPEHGRYQFATNSDDSSMLFVDDKPIAEFPGFHGATAVWGEKNGSIDLKAGIHKLDYFHVEYGRAFISC